MINHIITFEQMKFGMLQKLSGCLGISFSELVNTVPVLAPVPGPNNTIAGYAVSFTSYTAADTFKKMKRVSADGKVYLDFYIVNNMIPFSEN